MWKSIIITSIFVFCYQQWRWQPQSDLQLCQLLWTLTSKCDKTENADGQCSYTNHSVYSVSKDCVTICTLSIIFYIMLWQASGHSIPSIHTCCMHYFAPAVARGFLNTKMTESPRRNIFEMNLSLFTGFAWNKHKWNILAFLSVYYSLGFFKLVNMPVLLPKK